MPLVTLRDLYIADLQMLLDAEQHQLVELPMLARSSTSTELRELLDAHAAETRVHTERLELLLRRLDARGGSAPCDAMHGIIKEGRRRLDEGERGQVLDAAIIGIVQRMAHYEIAAYGCVRAYARTLKDDEAVALLDQTLDEEGTVDEHLTRIATDGVNEAAGDDVRADTDAQRNRLRYLPASQIPEFKYRAFRIRNEANEDLGSLDGVILDAQSGRPEYIVIDSGGWFVGRRFVVPIDAVRPEDSSQTLRTNLDRVAIASYPPFNPDSYTGDQDEADRSRAEHQPPTWLMTGVWMTEASGFASVPPRADADFAAPTRDEATERENDVMIARGEPEERGEEALGGRERKTDRWRPRAED